MNARLLIPVAVAAGALILWADVEKPGTIRHITAADLPKPYATPSANNSPHIVPRPEGVLPQAPPGFKVDLFASGLHTPRAMKTAPNGDVFLAETGAGHILVYRGSTATDYVSDLGPVFGLAFYPATNPQWLYASNTTTVVRFPYRNGDLTATGKPETVISGIPGGGHSTRDLAFSKDGKSLFVAVGSGSNVDDPDTTPGEKNRANVLEYTPEGKFVRVYGSGIRNPVGLAVDPATGQLWCSVNERDGLGDNLVPDYITHIEPGGFYGWPWFYTGGNQDPRHAGKHPELKGKVIVPDVLLPAHNASLQLVFYKGDIFAAEHGSWNSSVRKGHEVIRIRLKNGKSDGSYEDFLTGFVLPNGDAWGRPVGVAAASDGSLLVSDDASGSIWRVSENAAAR